MGKRMNLFADDDDVSASPDISKIKIDKEYARRYEYNKKREDLQRYEELKKQGRVEDSDSDSETDSESDSDSSVDVNLFNPSKKEDIDFFDKLMKVRNRDPSVYEKSKLFDSDSDDDDNDEDEENDMNDTDKKKGKKKLYLKDVVAQQLIEEGPDFEESEHDKEFKRKMSYNQEQEELRKQFLDAVGDAENGEDDGFLKMKEQDGKRDDEDEGDGEFEKKLDQYFGREDEDLDENQKFLKEFFMNKMWINKENKKDVLDDDEVDELLQDEEEVERQEQYEGTYNFRHEENAGDRVMGHSRKVEGSVRKKDNARKEQRKSKEERMKIAEMERKEELKHLKNLKKQEMKERMRKVMEAAGIKDDNDCLLDLDDLEEDFDPDEYDKMMKKAFNDKYYEAEDVDPDFGSDHDEDGAEIEKPDFDKEDELLGLPKGWDEVNSNDGFQAARERVLMLKAKNGDNDDDDSEEEEEEEEEIDDDEVNEKGDNEEEKTEECKRKRKRKLSMVKKVKEELMEEYYKLDYEGTVGDLKTRFKYAKVKPSSYGLKAEEILWLDDKDLNQYVSLKKIAPYREKEWQVPKAKRHLQKKKLYEVSEKPKGKKHRKKSISSKDIGETSSSNLNAEGDAKTELNVSNGGESNLSRKQKRKLKQKEYKLGHLRQIAYGQIQPKKKAKH